jgi:hypothetical protein
MFLVALLLLAPSAGAAPTPVADYVFNGNLTSAVAGAPALTVVGSGTAFASETVIGSARPVLTFPVGTGLALAPTTSVLTSSGVYTVMMLVRLDGNIYDISKYLDFNNLADNEGLYAYAGKLGFYNAAYSNAHVITTGYLEVALTRDANSDVVGYLFADPLFTYNDSLALIAVVGSGHTLNFFLDDVITNNLQASAGAVARIRVWNSALSADEITAVSIQTVFRDGFE